MTIATERLQRTAAADDEWAHRGFGSLAQSVLIVCLAVIYSGVERYFYLISRPLQYGFDLLVVVSILSIVQVRWRPRAITDAIPYVVWVAIYTAWGLLVSTSSQGQLVSNAISALALNVLVFAGIFIAIRDRRSLNLMAYLIQLVALINVGVILWEAADPTTTVALANFAQTTYYVLDRPGGLWIYPNQAAIALLFAAIFSFWAKGPYTWLIWAARLGCVIGIFVTGSRTGMYPLVICSAIFGVIAIISSGLDRRLWGLIIAFAAGATIAFIAIVFSYAPDVVAGFGSNYDLSRFFDFEQTLRAPSDPSRLATVQIWLPRALDGPWQGSGIYSFQGTLTFPGAHNMYLTVWGETGIAGLFAYVCAFAFGIYRTLAVRINRFDRAVVVTAWVTYLAIALTSHDLVAWVVDIVIIAMLYRLPGIVGAVEPIDANSRHS